MTESKRKLGIWTHGCRLNRYESDGIAGALIAKGNYEYTENSSELDLAIINTCTVTNGADSSNRNTIRKLKRRYPNAKIVVTGCYAETDPEKIAELGEADLIVPNRNKGIIHNIIEETLFSSKKLSENTIYEGHEESDRFSYGAALPHGHVRSYLKIQDGCDRKCTYCKIPRARGKGISLDSDEVLRRVILLQEEGVKEIVLTGVNLGWYRDKNKTVRFNQLISQILKNLDGTRLRISSIEPCDVNEQLAELTLHPAFCNYMHIPLQSGSRTVLRRMKRTYVPETFRLRIEKLLRINPDIFLGTDLMIGFPGETDQDFLDSLNLLNDTGFARIHNFPYSKRDQTPAADFLDVVSGEAVKKRMQRADELSLELWMKYARRFEGKTLEAVVENSETENGRALTGNYLSLIFNHADHIKPGELRTFILKKPLFNQKFTATPR